VIAGKTWREIRVMAAVYLLILELLMLPVILLWPDLYGDLQKSTLLRTLSSLFSSGESIQKGVTHKNEDVAYSSWVALQLFFKDVNLAGIAAAVLFGTALFAREREAMTFEFLLARPVSRGRILWAKSWPTALCVAVPVFLANWSAIWLSAAIDFSLPFWPLTLCCLHGALFAVCFLAFTTWVSILCRVQAHVAFWVGGITIVEIGMYLIPRLRRLSVFHLSDFDCYSPLLLGNRNLVDMFDPIRHQGLSAWLLACTAVFYGLALRALRRLEP
jgi:ABC-type transport system involved in multi-copper enzyme maturation permease subunit